MQPVGWLLRPKNWPVGHYAPADLSRETAATRKLYGLDEAETAEFGTQCLMARRMVERGVRFIQVVSGTLDIKGDNRDWDAHQDLEENHGAHARAIGNRLPVCSPI